MESLNLQGHKPLVLAYDAKRLFHNFTGLGNYSRTLLRNLQELYPQHEYHLFTPRLKRNAETEYFLDNNKFHIHTPKRFNPLWRTVGMSEEINDLRPNIFHGLSHEIPFGINKSIRTIVTFHDLIYHHYPEQFNWFDRKMYAWKYRSSALRADNIVAISKSTQSDLIDIYKIAPEKISVLYQSCHPVFMDDYFSTGYIPAEIAHLENYYLYVGSIIERKGLLQSVIAFSKLDAQHKHPFVIVGKGSHKYLTQVHDMIKYYGLEEYFYFLGSISNNELVTIYDQSLCLIYPSVYEGFGIPVIESLFRSKPVITSNISSLPEAAGPGAVLVNPFSPDDIAAAMTAIHQQTTYDKLSQQGLEYVKQNFGSEATSQQIMNFYQILS